MTLPESEPQEVCKYREEPGQVSRYQNPLTCWYTTIDMDSWTGLRRDIIKTLKHFVTGLHKLVFLHPLQRKHITNGGEKKNV